MYKKWLKHIGLKLLFVLIVLASSFWSHAYSAENIDNERGKKMKIAIITAMKSEYAAVKKLYDFEGDNQKAEAEAYGNKVILILSGMGKVNATIATERAIREEKADLVINTGLAGGIDSSLDQGDIVLAQKVAYHDVWCGEGNAMGQMQGMPLYYDSPVDIIQKISAIAPDFKLGLMVTGDQFLTDVNRLKEIKSNFPEALAVDMESAAVAQTCHINKKPYISLRIISDVVGKPGQVEEYQTFRENMPNQAAEMLDKTLKAIAD